MDKAGTENRNDSLTPSQREAVAARGNVLVMAGAGTGKTHTLVERCLDLICNERVSLDEMLIVTFTEAAAAELRERLRDGLEDAAGKCPADAHLPEQLALFEAAHIGTLHSFCFKLVREHFHALNLDPQLSVLDEAQVRLLADEILEEQFQSHYEYVPGPAPGPEIAESATNQSTLTAAVPSPFPMVAPAQAGFQQSTNPTSGPVAPVQTGSSIQRSMPALAQPARNRRRAARQKKSDNGLQLDLFGESEAGKGAAGADVPSAESPSIQQSNSPLFQSSVAVQSAQPPAETKNAPPLLTTVAGQRFNPSTSSQFSLAVQDVITVYGNGRDEAIRALVLRLYHYIQTRADAGAWLARQIEDFSNADPVKWREWLSKAIEEWRGEWLPLLKNLRDENVKAAECFNILELFPTEVALSALSCGPLFEKIAAADRTESYPYREKTALRKPLEAFFEDAEFLASLILEGKDEKDSPARSYPASTLQRFNASTTPLREDWEWSRGHMKTLLLLAKEFAEKFSARKRADGVLDFHDLEQFAIKLLWGNEAKGGVAPTAVAAQWRAKLRFVFVDEYQDINAAQDKIISALGADNRFLVGDVKQSIYRFRLADPAIFRDYARNPGGWNARVISLTENFRSREGLLDFVNSVFKPLMSENLGGVLYDDKAELKFGSAATRAELSVRQNPGPHVEMLLREKKRGESADAENGEDSIAGLQEAELEALMVATRLREQKESGHLIWDDGKLRPAEWSDFAVLLRSPGAKAEIYAKQFANANVPLHVERGGFYDSAEILDLLSLLQLADNPLQDVPCIAVLRSPLVGCSLDELAEIRMAAHGRFWFAVNRAAASGSGVNEITREKIAKFLRRFSNWRKLARQASLSACLDAILTDTHYDDWLLSRPRGEQRHANVQRFLHLAEQFDAFQRQGLFRFLKFVDAQREMEAEPDVAPMAEENAVRLMSVHQSKGLEFPVVVLADLGKTFNEQDLRGAIILDEQFGLCPKVKPPSSGGRYPSLAYWLARKNQRRELRGEELRLLYVGLTRARDTLILSGGVSAKKWEAYFENHAAIGPRDIVSANSCMDWLGIWFAVQGSSFTVEAGAHGESPLLRWRVATAHETSAAVAVANQLTATLQAVPAQAGLPNDTSWSEMAKRINWKYPFEPATQQKAKTSVTALRREMADEEAEQMFRPRIRRAPVTATPINRQEAPARLNAADTGVAHHKFLQYFAFETSTDLKSFAAEAKRLEEEHYLSADEAAALDLEALADFWISEIGKRIRANAPQVRRELAFTAAFEPAELDEIFEKEQGVDLDGEMIVVQGVADLAVLLPKEIWLVDFKTDDVTVKDLPGKIEIYSPQLKLYARALEKIYSRQVTDCRLHFLGPRKTIQIVSRNRSA